MELSHLQAVRTFFYNWGGACGAHVFEEFFGLEDESVKSVKMKVETKVGILWRLQHEFAFVQLTISVCSPVGGFGNLCQTTSSFGFYSISRTHSRDRKTLRKRVHSLSVGFLSAFTTWSLIRN